MASAPQPQLPLFYNDLLPLSSNDHKAYKVKAFDDASFLASTHAIPVTVDEFVDAQRSFPIVFTSGEPLPIALLGLNEGVNVFIGEDGKLVPEVYVPAYVRRYPFMLARLREGAEDLSLCFDPSSGVVGDHAEGNALFNDKGEKTEYTDSLLDFCSKYEQAGQRTRQFIDRLKALDILMDGEIAITRADMPDKPFVYRGFQMVDENKLRELPAEKLEELNKNGMLLIIHAHLFSMNLMRRIFERQSALGKVPMPEAAASN